MSCHFSWLSADTHFLLLSRCLGSCHVMVVLLLVSEGVEGVGLVDVLQVVAAPAAGVVGGAGGRWMMRAGGFLEESMAYQKYQLLLLESWQERYSLPLGPSAWLGQRTAVVTRGTSAGVWVHGLTSSNAPPAPTLTTWTYLVIRDFLALRGVTETAQSPPPVS